MPRIQLRIEVSSGLAYLHIFTNLIQNKVAAERVASNKFPGYMSLPPQVVTLQRQLVQGMGAGGTGRVCDLAQLGLMRARLRSAQAAVWRAADAIPG